MARYQNPFAGSMERYPTDPSWGAVGSNLATALFGNPEMAAQAALRKAQMEQAQAEAAYNNARAEGQGYTNNGLAALMDPNSTVITHPSQAPAAAPVAPTLPSVNYGAATPATPAAPSVAPRAFNSAALSSLVKAVAPNAVITSGARSPNSALGRANPKSLHNLPEGGAIDMAAVPGMTFEQMRDTLVRNGLPANQLEAIDEYKNPSPHATGPHWHFGVRPTAVAAPQRAGVPAPATVTAPQLAPEMAGAEVDPAAVSNLVRILALSGNAGHTSDVVATLLGAAGGDQAARRALIVRGNSPSKDFAADRQAQLNNEAIDQYGGLAKAVATGNISQAGDVYKADQSLAGDKYRAEKSLEGDKYRADRAYAADVYKADHSGTGPGGKPVAAGIQKTIDEHLHDIATAESNSADIASLISQLHDGKIRLGPYENQLSEGANWLGVSTNNSRNYNSLKATIEKIKNDTLRLNKGVQTEGDAQRAANELSSNINDAGVLQQRLAEIRAINARAVELRKLQINQLRSDNNMAPIDYTPYSRQPAALRGGSRPPLSSFQR